MMLVILIYLVLPSTLDDGAGNILTTTTDVDGNYLFEDVTPGNYTITQENDTDFVDVTDVEGGSRR